MEVNTFITTCSIADVALRLGVSAVLGFAIGFEREYTSKWAGIKTNMLVAIGSTLFTILSIYSFPKIAVTGATMCVGDPSRVAAQILTGIGFIGGGTVLRHGVSVYGLTTAATLWMVASIGMAVGAGEIKLSILATLIVVLVLVFLRKFQYMFIKPNLKTFATIKVIFSSPDEYTQEIIDHATNNFNNVLEIKKRPSHKESGYTHVVLKLEVIEKEPIKTVYSFFEKLEHIESLTIEQNTNE